MQRFRVEKKIITELRISRKCLTLTYRIPHRANVSRRHEREKVDTSAEGAEAGQGREVCKIKCIERARHKIHPPRAPEGRGRNEGEHEGERFRKRRGKRRNERTNERTNSGRRGINQTGHPKVPRNTKQKKDRRPRCWRRDAGKRISEKRGRLFSNNLPRRRDGAGRRRRRGSPGGGFPAAAAAVAAEEEKEDEEDGAEGGSERGAVGCLLLLESGRAHTTDTIAAINTGEQPLTSPTGGPDIILYLETNSPRADLLQERGEKIHLLGPREPPARLPPPACTLPHSSTCHPIHLTYRVNVKVPESPRRKRRQGKGVEEQRVF